VLIAATSSLPETAWVEAASALRRVMTSHPEVRVLLCGEAARRGAVMGLSCECLPRLDGVRFEGYLAEQPVCVALYPTGRPPWVQDLLAAGCPVVAVASCLEQVPDASEQDEGRIQVPARSDAIASTIESLLDNAVRLTALISRIGRFGLMPDPQDAARTLLRAYREAADPHSSRNRKECQEPHDPLARVA
jgi:hypothetical protein